MQIQARSRPQAAARSPTAVTFVQWTHRPKAIKEVIYLTDSMRRVDARERRPELECRYALHYFTLV